nr:hypothetical protein GCM10025732_27710 [Glycomyces mayteni]
MFVQGGAVAEGGGEALLADGGVDHADDGDAVAGEGEGHGVERGAVGEVDGAVDRVEDPLVVGLGVAGAAALLAEERDVGVSAARNSRTASSTA